MRIAHVLLNFSCVEMNGGILCASIPAVPMFFRQTTFGMRILNTLEYRLSGFNMTSPSVGVKSSLGSKSEEYVELEEGHDRKRLVVDRTA